MSIVLINFFKNVFDLFLLDWFYPFFIEWQKPEQMVCEIEIDENGHLIMLDEDGDDIVGNITPEEWEQIKEAIEDTLG